MTENKRADQAFQDFLEGKSSSASSDVERLAKLAEALRPAQSAGPSSQFRARLRSTLLAHASATPEDSFAMALEGVLIEAPAEVKPLVAVAAALEPARLPLPDVSFRYELRNRLIAEAARNRPLADRIAVRLAAMNLRMRRSFKVVVATGMVSMLLFGSSLALAMSASAVPGDALWRVKRWHEAARLIPLSGESEGRQLLAYARERLAEMQTMTDRGVRDTDLFVDALSLMDAQTTDATTILIGVFEQTGQRSVLDRVTAFALLQAADLTGLIPVLPPGARPAARGSLEHVEAAVVQIQNVLSGCACPTDPQFGSDLSFAGSSEPAFEARCTCGVAPAGSNPDQAPSGSGSQGDGTNPDTNPPPTPPADEGPSVDVPDDVPDPVETPAESLIDELIDTINSPLPVPSVIPSTVPSLEPSSILP